MVVVGVALRLPWLLATALSLLVLAFLLLLLMLFLFSLEELDTKGEDEEGEGACVWEDDGGGAGCELLRRPEAPPSLTLLLKRAVVEIDWSELEVHELDGSAMPLSLPRLLLTPMLAKGMASAKPTAALKVAGAFELDLFRRGDKNRLVLVRLPRLLPLGPALPDCWLAMVWSSRRMKLGT